MSLHINNIFNRIRYCSCNEKSECLNDNPCMIKVVTTEKCLDSQCLIKEITKEEVINVKIP